MLKLAGWFIGFAGLLHEAPRSRQRQGALPGGLYRIVLPRGKIKIAYIQPSFSAWYFRGYHLNYRYRESELPRFASLFTPARRTRTRVYLSNHLVLVKRVPTAKAYGLVKVIYRPVKYIPLVRRVRAETASGQFSFNSRAKCLRASREKYSSIVPWQASIRIPEKYRFVGVQPEMEISIVFIYYPRFEPDISILSRQVIFIFFRRKQKYKNPRDFKSSLFKIDILG